MNRALLKSILSFPLALSPVSVAALTAIMMPSTAEAAEGGSIRGIVSDAETGEPVSDAIIIVQCNCLESPRETRPNAAGVYALYDLPPGRYTVQVLAGKQSTSKVVTLEREQSTNMNFSVTPSKPEVIEVEVDAAPVQQDTASGISVKMKEVQNVPVGGSASRDFTDVVLMSPTAEKTAGGISLGGTTAVHARWRFGE